MIHIGINTDNVNRIVFNNEDYFKMCVGEFEVWNAAAPGEYVLYYTTTDGSKLNIEHTQAYSKFGANITSEHYDAVHGGYINFDGPITAIGLQAIYQQAKLATITIPDTVTYLGNNAFGGCTSLTNIVIPSGVTSINQQAFAGSGLETIQFNGVPSFGANVFQNCQHLREIEIPSGVTSLTGGMFDSCTSLTAVTIPDTVIFLGESVFENCSNLTTLNIPSSVREIGAKCFKNSGVQNNMLLSGVTTIGNEAFASTSCNVYLPNTLTHLGTSVFQGSGARTIEFPLSSTITSIPYGTFEESAIMTFAVPAYITNIEERAFYNSSLQKLSMVRATAPMLGNNAIYLVGTNGKLRIPQGSTGYDTWLEQITDYQLQHSWTIEEY